jgi:hypothetical protein
MEGLNSIIQASLTINQKPIDVDLGFAFNPTSSSVALQNKPNTFIKNNNESSKNNIGTSG